VLAGAAGEATEIDVLFLCGFFWQDYFGRHSISPDPIIPRGNWHPFTTIIEDAVHVRQTQNRESILLTDDVRLSEPDFSKSDLTT
jgi:hypothetical protein